MKHIWVICSEDGECPGVLAYEAVCETKKAAEAVIAGWEGWEKPKRYVCPGYNKWYRHASIYIIVKAEMREASKQPASIPV